MKITLTMSNQTKAEPSIRGSGWKADCPKCVASKFTCDEHSQQPEPGAPAGAFQRGDLVRKKSGSSWRGRIVGDYSATWTVDGYNVESLFEPGNVQVYPAAALLPWSAKEGHLGIDLPGFRVVRDLSEEERETLVRALVDSNEDELCEADAFRAVLDAVFGPVKGECP
jgi:hypothetical protein